jgi:hypothetical protein
VLQKLKSAVSMADFGRIRTFMRNLDPSSWPLGARILPLSVGSALIELSFSK